MKYATTHRARRRKVYQAHPMRYVAIFAASMTLVIGGSLLNRIQHPTFISPVPAYAEVDEPTPTPTPTLEATTGTVTAVVSPEHAYILTKHHPDILWRMYGLESSYGRNDACKAHGEVNGFGFSQDKTTWKCYGSFAEVVDKVDAWLDTELESHTLAQTLCIYNQGVDESTCKYADNFLNL